jgi:hypothetical protein
MGKLTATLEAAALADAVADAPQLVAVAVAAAAAAVHQARRNPISVASMETVSIRQSVAGKDGVTAGTY